MSDNSPRGDSGWKQSVADLFVRFGAGSPYIQRFTQWKAWNTICWVLIALGLIGWAAFLMWKPPG